MYFSFFFKEIAYILIFSTKCMWQKPGVVPKSKAPLPRAIPHCFERPPATSWGCQGGQFPCQTLPTFGFPIFLSSSFSQGCLWALSPAPPVPTFQLDSHMPWKLKCLTHLCCKLCIIQTSFRPALVLFRLFCQRFKGLNNPASVSCCHSSSFRAEGHPLGRGFITPSLGRGLQGPVKAQKGRWDRVSRSVFSWGVALQFSSDPKTDPWHQNV